MFFGSTNNNCKYIINIYHVSKSLYIKPVVKNQVVSIYKVPVRDQRNLVYTQIRSPYALAFFIWYIYPEVELQMTDARITDPMIFEYDLDDVMNPEDVIFSNDSVYDLFVGDDKEIGHSIHDHQTIGRIDPISRGYCKVNKMVI